MAIKYGNISFHFPVKGYYLKNRQELKTYLKSILKAHGKSLSRIDYIFCSDEFLHGINLKFLKHNTFTDIITFDLSEKESLIGEIYISVDRIKENSVAFQTSTKEELHRVIFHGVLHLCGFRDKTRAEKQEMREQEDFHLQTYFKKFHVERN